MRKAALILLLFSVAGSSGCMSLDAYFNDRGNDFADIFTGKVGLGFGIHTSVSVFGLVSTHIGISKTYRIGYDGREYVEEDHTVLGTPVFNLFVVPVSLARGDYRKYNNKPLGFASAVITLLTPGAEKIHKNPGKRLDYLDTLFEFSTADVELWLYGYGQYLGLNPPVENPLSRGVRDYDLKVSQTFFIASYEVGFNPVEFADFILGFFLIDIMGDDEKSKKPKPKPKPKPEPKPKPKPKPKPELKEKKEVKVKSEE